MPNRRKPLNADPLGGMTNLVDWRVFLPAVAVLGGLGLIASRFLGVPFLPAFVVLVAAVLINGFVATLEDDSPGGFNNPDGTETPSYVHVTGRVVKWLAAAVLSAFAVAFLITGLGVEADAPIPFVVGVSLACILLALALFGRSRQLLWFALLVAFAGIGLGALWP